MVSKANLVKINWQTCICNDIVGVIIAKAPALCVYAFHELTDIPTDAEYNKLQ